MKTVINNIKENNTKMNRRNYEKVRLSKLNTGAFLHSLPHVGLGFPWLWSLVFGIIEFGNETDSGAGKGGWKVYWLWSETFIGSKLSSLLSVSAMEE